MFFICVNYGEKGEGRGIYSGKVKAISSQPSTLQGVHNIIYFYLREYI